MDAFSRELLTTSPNGPRLCISLLDQTALLLDKEESTDGGRAFGIGYVIADTPVLPVNRGARQKLRHSLILFIRISASHLLFRLQIHNCHPTY